jgi:transposase InsO family protein
MPAVGDIPFFGLPPTSQGQRGGLRDHRADRPAVPGSADYGSRRMAAWLATKGHVVNHKIYPYLLGGISIERVNQVWCSDVTYIPMAKGFLYLVVIMDWVSRAVLA